MHQLARRGLLDLLLLLLRLERGRGLSGNTSHEDDTHKALALASARVCIGGAP
jgi:hypothetical protein